MMAESEKTELQVWLIVIPIIVWWMVLAMSDWIWIKLGMYEWAQNHPLKHGDGILFFGVLTGALWFGFIRLLTLAFRGFANRRRSGCREYNCRH